jgi:hypothetical protein
MLPDPVVEKHIRRIFEYPDFNFAWLQRARIRHKAIKSISQMLLSVKSEIIAVVQVACKRPEVVLDDKLLLPKVKLSCGLMISFSK